MYGLVGPKGYAGMSEYRADCEKAQTIGKQAATKVIAWRTQRKADLDTWVSYVFKHMCAEILSAASKGSVERAIDMADLWRDVHMGVVTGDCERQVPPSCDEWKGDGSATWLRFNGVTVLELLVKKLRDQDLIVREEMTNECSTRLYDTVQKKETTIRYSLKFYISCPLAM